ncbi:MAG: transcriptional regulator NrdR [Actinomycetota bacterium]
MLCPYCRTSEAKVVDSRDADGGLAIRRRRECLGCSRRYTTFERIESVGLRVLKRSGVIEPYERGKVVDGIRKACKNRPVSEMQVNAVADQIDAAVWAPGVSQVTTQSLGLAVLEHLRHLDDVAYLRFASVYKDFQQIGDFEREVGLLLQKTTPPKPATAGTAGAAPVTAGVASEQNRGG